MEMCSDLSVTFFVLASYETDLLHQTVSQIQAQCPPEHMNEIVLVLPSEQCPSYYAAKTFQAKEDSWSRIRIYIQKAHNLQRTLAELPPLAKGTHFLFIASDTEMNTGTIPDFIREAKEHPDWIISASKWKKESVVQGYGTLPAIFTHIVNAIACALIHTRATDLFSIYQLYPVCVYRAMHFDNPATFAFEYSLKPIRLGVGYKEIPTTYIGIPGRKSTYNFWGRVKLSMAFFGAAIRLRCTPKKYLLRHK